MKLSYTYSLFWAFACTAIPPELFKPWTNQSVEYVGNDTNIPKHSHYFENQS
jgi:hypothetical protein